MKTFARTVLLSLWLFAIVAPSVITLMDVDNPVIVTNLNEEEQQETSKKSPVEEKMLHGQPCDFSVIAQSKKSFKGNHHAIIHSNHTSEILVPPPEHIG